MLAVTLKRATDSSSPGDHVIQALGSETVDMVSREQFSAVKYGSGRHHRQFTEYRPHATSLALTLDSSKGRLMHRDYSSAHLSKGFIWLWVGVKSLPLTIVQW